MQTSQTVGLRRPRQHPPPAGTRQHEVQFYHDDAFLLDQVERFLRPGLEQGGAGLVIATPAHREELARRLAGRGLSARMLDAQGTLDLLMADGGPDPARFRATVGAAVAEAAAGGRRVWAFGEMVALLCAQGRHAAAIALERLWNDLAREATFSLLCGYPMDAFRGAEARFADACAEHASVRAGEGYAGAAGPEQRQRYVALLEQKAAELDRERGERQALAGRLAAKEEELRDFVANGPDGMHQVDADGTILWVNQAELDMLGYRRDEYVGRNVREFHEDPAAVEAILASLRRGEPVRNFRSRLRRKDGAYRDVLVNSNVVQDAAGRFARSRCVVRDVTDLAEAERGRQAVQEELQRRERQQAAVARLGREALARSDLDGLFALAAREVAQTLGVERASVLELCSGGQQMRFRAAHGFSGALLRSALVPAGPGTQAGAVLASDGPLAYHGLADDLRFDPSPLLLSEGCHSGMTVAIPTRGGPFGTLGAHSLRPRRFTEDDSNFLDAVAHVLASAIERKAAEEELQRSRDLLEATVAERTRQLEASNRELEAFSYSVSHDLRAPLRSITGYSTLLATRHGGDLAPEARELVEGVRKGAERLGRLIDDLLDLSRVQRVDLSREPVDLSALARQSLEALAAAEPERRVSWAVQPGLVADGDARLLGMLLDNLLGNAWKFTRRTPDARIRVRRQGAGGDSVFCVQDNGAGFDMAYAAKLFQPFQRLHRASEFEGTGVGLATVRRIVERHGGRAWAEGRPGSGATFYFTLSGRA